MTVSVPRSDDAWAYGFFAGCALMSGRYSRYAEERDKFLAWKDDAVIAPPLATVPDRVVEGGL